MLGQEEMTELGLSEILPVWVGPEMDVKSTSLKAKNNRNMDNWYVDLHILTDEFKREMFAQLMKISTLIMMISTCYTFGGNIYQQRSGAGIGLRGSAALAKLTMGKWDNRWASLMTSWCIRAKIFIRYIDDLRIYMHPIRKGWFWSDSGWVFDPHRVDERNNMQRTCEELTKSFNSIMNFLRFTCESEADFSTGFLPTLDVEIQVQINGFMMYRFYSKPTNNNLVIENGTGLAKDIVFSSLRQEVIRRLSNTCDLVSNEQKNEIVCDLIQLMINSKHKFAFIKSVILQGLTKFQFMKYRSKLAPTDRKFMPLHRERGFKRHERILIKYVNVMLWYKEEKLSDPFRQLWKRKIRRKSDCPPVHKRLNLRNKQRNGKMPPRTTTTMFVPQSQNSLLFKLISDRENLLKHQIGWGVKVLESPGTKLLNCFITKFPIRNGCPRGSLCCICENKGVKCCTKGAIYLATCTRCDADMKKKGKFASPELDKENHDLTLPPSYVGETSRPWRERVLEHQQGIIKLKTDSVFVEHWMDQHGLETKCPTFKFQILSSYGDALRRQLCEAINITDRGTLNRKNEYNCNQLCRLEPSKHTWEQEKLVKIESNTRKLTKEKMKNFCDVMNNVQNRHNGGNVVDELIVYRYKRKVGTRYQHTTGEREEKRKKIMDTSTPVGNRAAYRVIEEAPTSPIGNTIDNTCSSDEANTGSLRSPEANHTNLSGGMDACNLTPPAVESESTEERNMDRHVTCLIWAAVDRQLIPRTNSLPNLLGNVSSNAMFGPYPTRVKSLVNVSGGSIDFTQWSENDLIHMESIERRMEQMGISCGRNIINEESMDELNLAPTEQATSPQSGEKELTSKIVSDGGLCSGTVTEDILTPPAVQLIAPVNEENPSVASPAVGVSVLDVVQEVILPVETELETVAIGGSRISKNETTAIGDSGISSDETVAIGGSGISTNYGLRESAISLGSGATPELLHTTPNDRMPKRRVTSPDAQDMLRPRKLSICEGDMSPALRRGKSIFVSPLSNRRNTWTSPCEVKKSRKRVKAARIDKKQPLIRTLLKQLDDKQGEDGISELKKE